MTGNPKTTRGRCNAASREAVEAMRAYEHRALVGSFARWQPIARAWAEPDPDADPDAMPSISDLLALRSAILDMKPRTLWGQGAQYLASRTAFEIGSAVWWHPNESENARVMLPLGAIRRAHLFTGAALTFLKLS